MWELSAGIKCLLPGKGINIFNNFLKYFCTVEGEFSSSAKIFPQIHWYPSKEPLSFPKFYHAVFEKNSCHDVCMSKRRFDLSHVYSLICLSSVRPWFGWNCNWSSHCVHGYTAKFTVLHLVSLPAHRIKKKKRLINLRNMSWSQNRKMWPEEEFDKIVVEIILFW